MLKRQHVKFVGGLLLLAILAVLSGCGRGKAAPATPDNTPARQPSAAVGTSQSASPAPAPARPASPPPADDLLAEGEAVFMQRAAGIGCQACHGVDARGNTTVGGPDIRGRAETEVRGALENVEMMRIIKLSDKEIEAVVAYLQYLNRSAEEKGAAEDC